MPNVTRPANALGLPDASRTVKETRMLIADMNIDAILDELKDEAKRMRGLAMAATKFTQHSDLDADGEPDIVQAVRASVDALWSQAATVDRLVDRLISARQQ